MRARWALWGILAAGGGAVAACGGTTDTPAFKSTDGGSGGSGGAGKGTGGASGGVGTGGKAQGGSGGSAGSSGAPGTGGAEPGDAGPCPAPTAAGMTRMCLTLSPEQITAHAEPALDKRGILVVQIFDIPNPPNENAGAVALAEAILPKGAALGGDAGPGPEIGLDELKEMRIEKAFPAIVYVRAIFIDDRSVFNGKNGPLGYGAWLGGLNLANGIQEGEPLTPVSLKVGEGNVVDVPLVALRRLTATVHRTAAPIGDGQGPLNIVVLNNSNPAGRDLGDGGTRKPDLFGAATKQCADVVAGDVTVTGFVVGSGPYWITGILNDLGIKKEFPPGALVSLNQVGSVYTIPNQLTYAPTDYAVNATFNLNFVAPWDTDAGPIPPNSCADIAAGADAGP